MRTPANECYDCKHERPNVGNAHLSCTNPDPRVGETGDTHGIVNGWFFYPLLFDPIWKTRLCRNYQPKKKEA